MPRRLKVFRTHLGFYDMIVAAPSQKAAAQAWGADPHLFARGFAKVASDPELVKAALDKPGVVLRRQFGSDAEFTENATPIVLPPLSSEEKAARRKRAEHAAAEAEKRKTARERADRTAAADRMERAKQRSTKAQAREKAAAEREERRAAKERAQAEAAHRREEERAAAGRRRDLQVQLKLLMRQRESRLRDIESRRAALEAERRKIDQHFGAQILAVRKQIEKA